MRSGRGALTAAVVLLGACSGTGTAATVATINAATTTTGVTPSSAPTTAAVSTAPGATLPPHTYEQLLPLLDPMVAPLGFRVTRAALVDLGTYESSPGGTHLAVYVEPLAPRDADSVAAATVPLATALLPEVFLRWPALESFDICQEPFEATLDRIAPPDTVLDLTRETALAIDWEAVTLGELLHWTGGGLSLHASDAIRMSSTWVAAQGPPA